MEQVRFDDAFSSVGSWTPAECARMVEACNARIAEEADAALAAAGLFENDPLYRPMTEEQFISELKAARESSSAGHVMDALEFADALRLELDL